MVLPDIVGLHEFAALLGISDSRIGQLEKQDPNFPKFKQLKCGKIWLLSDVLKYKETRNTKNGRPKKVENMSTYKQKLPELFPYCANLKINICRIAVDLLMSAHRKDVPNGSSFALTVDSYDGTWNLWLSKASYDFLCRYPDLDVLNHTILNIEELAE